MLSFPLAKNIREPEMRLPVKAIILFFGFKGGFANL